MDNSSLQEQDAVVHYDDMLENVVNTVKSAYEDEGFDPSSPLVTEAALNAFLMEAYEQEVLQLREPVRRTDQCLQRRCQALDAYQGTQNHL